MINQFWGPCDCNHDAPPGIGSGNMAVYFSPLIVTIVQLKPFYFIPLSQSLSLQMS